MDRARRTIGIFALAVSFAAYLIIVSIDPKFRLIIEETYWLESLVICTWIFLSFLNKIGMVVNQKVASIHSLSLVLYILILLLILVSGSGSAEETLPLTAIDELVLIIFFGWPIIDALDFFVLDERY